MSQDQGTRRQYLVALGAVAVTGTAGCQGVLSSDDSDDTPTQSTASETTQTASAVGDGTREGYVGVAERGAARIEEWRTRRADATRKLSQAEVIRNDRESERRSLLASSAEALPRDIYQIHLVDRETADIVASTSDVRSGQKLTGREAPWFPDELQYGEDGTFVSRAVESHGRSLVSFASPVETDTQLVFVMQTDFDRVSRDLQTTADGGYTAVVDGDARVVGDSMETVSLDRNDGLLSEYRRADAPTLQRWLDGESGFVGASELADPETGGESQDYVAAFAAVDGLPWVVVTHVPVSEAQ